MFKNLSKKILAGITAAAFGLTITISSPANAESKVSWGDVASTVISASISYNQMNQQIKSLNDTEEGRTQLFNQFQEKTGVNNDPEINERMDSIMANLTRAVSKVDSSIQKKPYKYYVSNDKTLNAACSLGHVMVVNIGAFNNLPTDDEIAAIVGHEMGHGQKDHVMKANKKHLNKLVAAQLGAAAVGGGTIANAVATVIVNNSIAHGDRKQETEADNLAWEYMLRTNYNIGACAAVMQKLAELNGERNNSNILNPSDHPDTGKRRDNYVTKLYEYSGKHATAKNGVVEINGKTFTTVAAANSMSSAERSYFVLGNLAKAYHNNKHKEGAKVIDGTVYLGNMAIITPAAGDEDAYILAERLNELVNTSAKDDKSKKK